MKTTGSAKNTIDSTGIKCNFYQDWGMGLTYREDQRFESKQVHFSQFSLLISQSVKTVSQSAKVFPRQIYFNLVLDITYRCKIVQCLGSRASWIKISVNPDHLWKVTKCTEIFSVKSSGEVQWILMFQNDTVCNWSYLLLDKLCHLSPINVSYFIHLWSNSKWEAESNYWGYYIVCTA